MWNRGVVTFSSVGRPPLQREGTEQRKFSAFEVLKKVEDEI